LLWLGLQARTAQQARAHNAEVVEARTHVRRLYEVRLYEIALVFTAQSISLLHIKTVLMCHSDSDLAVKTSAMVEARTHVRRLYEVRSASMSLLFLCYSRA